MADARQLAALVKAPGVHVNLIPVNPVDETGFQAPDPERVRRFKETLEKAGVNATVRREMGRDINGACGQLRRGYESTGMERSVSAYNGKHFVRGNENRKAK